MKSTQLRIGVDVGGTNTDAVLLNGNEVVASTKTATTEFVSDDIVNSLTTIIEQTEIDPMHIKVVSIGTTHFTNAFVQRRDLDKVGVLRVALPAAKALPPFTDWPRDIQDAVGGIYEMVGGGYHYDGRVNSPLDEKAISTAAQRFKKKGLTSIAISALFAPVDESMEKRACEILLNEIPDAKITLSSKIGRIGLLERENAGIMNASLSTLASQTIDGFRLALNQLGITAPFYISQNDGTLMSADFVEHYPVLTFASGPTNIIRGAAYLSGLENAMVVDIGDTTTDIGVLRQGFPCESSLAVDIGSVRTNFRMPDILAIGLGGGSLVHEQNGNITIGPRSVGYQISKKALVFGGSTLTATDIAVAAGATDIGDKKFVAGLDPKMVAAAFDKIHQMVENGIDRMKTSNEDVPLILVGGGSVLIDRALAGVSDVITDNNAGVANAIGASIAQVSGEVDKVYSYDELGRDFVLGEAQKEATENAINAGADPDTIQVMDIEELPLAYIPGGAVRVRLKVAGELKI